MKYENLGLMQDTYYFSIYEVINIRDINGNRIMFIATDTTTESLV